MRGPQYIRYEPYEMTSSEALEFILPEDVSRGGREPYFAIFKWYNWGGKDFSIYMAARSDTAYFFVNQLSELTFYNNAITGIPLNHENA